MVTRALVYSCVFPAFNNSNTGHAKQVCKTYGNEYYCTYSIMLIVVAQDLLSLHRRVQHVRTKFKCNIYYFSPAKEKQDYDIVIYSLSLHACSVHVAI